MQFASSWPGSSLLYGFLLGRGTSGACLILERSDVTLRLSNEASQESRVNEKGSCSHFTDGKTEIQRGASCSFGFLLFYEDQ